MDRLLDEARSGPTFLSLRPIAELVWGSIQYGVKLQQYELHSWVIMPNHVHLLLTPRVSVSKLLRSLKAVTAKRANLLLKRTGKPFWQDESYDRLVRGNDEFRRIRCYIENNPVTAGLARTRRNTCGLAPIAAQPSDLRLVGQAHGLRRALRPAPQDFNNIRTAWPRSPAGDASAPTKARAELGRTVLVAQAHGLRRARRPALRQSSKIRRARLGAARRRRVCPIKAKATGTDRFSGAGPWPAPGASPGSPAQSSKIRRARLGAARRRRVCPTKAKATWGGQF